MKALLFRLDKVTGGRKLSFLTTQPETEELFAHGCKIAYKNNSASSELLAQWKAAWAVNS